TATGPPSRWARSTARRARRCPSTSSSPTGATITTSKTACRRMRSSLLALLLMAGSGAAAAPCAQQAFERSRFTVCPFDARAQEPHPVTPPSRGFAGISSRGVAFGMNAGMFDDTGAPIGLLIENGRTLHAINTAAGQGNFYMLPNGVFSQDEDGTLHVE